MILVGWIRIWIQEGKNRKREEILSFEVLDVLYWGLYSSLDVLYEGLGISKFHFLEKKISYKFFYNFWSEVGSGFFYKAESKKTVGYTIKKLPLLQLGCLGGRGSWVRGVVVKKVNGIKLQSNPLLTM